MCKSAILAHGFEPTFRGFLVNRKTVIRCSTVSMLLQYIIYRGHTLSFHSSHRFPIRRYVGSGHADDCRTRRWQERFGTISLFAKSTLRRSLHTQNHIAVGVEEKLSALKLTKNQAARLPRQSAPTFHRKLLLSIQWRTAPQSCRGTVFGHRRFLSHSCVRLSSATPVDPWSTTLQFT
jgi:hypothetical protein